MRRGVRSVPFWAAIALGAAPVHDLSTVAERSGDVRTGRYQEVERLCADFQEAFPGRAACVRFGTTPEGRPMLAVVASDDGLLDPASSRARGRPAVVLQGGIHAGEIDGKDAGFRVLRDALRGKVAPGVLGTVTLVFVAVLNADGHERFGPHHRANQRGPEEMGWRTTARNLNLNRDYAKAEAPEMKAVLGLMAAWDPVLYVDLHVTDGAKFRHDVSVQVDPAEVPGHPLAPAATALRRGVAERVRAQGHLPLEFYPSFRKEDDPSSGFAVGVAPPRLSTSYWGWRDRLGLLVETHSWKTYRERVKATYDVLVGVLEVARSRAASWRDVIKAVDAAATRVGGSDVTLAFDEGETETTIDFLGYAYRREPSDVSGAMRIVYDEAEPEVWRVPLATGVRPSLAVRAPKAGYVVPPAWAEWIAERLALHGFRSVPVAAPRPGLAVSVFRADEVRFGARPYEGRQTASVTGRWTRETRDVPAGSLFVPVGQPGVRLLLHLLEPLGPDSFVSWGFFNAVFEQKEYMEEYVAEELASRMLALSPALRGEFERKLATDPAFAGDSAARLQFFYRRSPWWDERKDEYPILQVDAW